MRLVALVLVSYLMLLVLGAVWSVIPLERAVPDVVALVAVYIGLTARVRLAKAMLAAVLVGYLGDLVFGTPRGLLAFSAGVICIFGHMVQGRLLVRGWLLTSLFSFLVAVIAGVIAIAARVGVGDSLSLGTELPIVFGSALLTALVGPFVFRICRGVDARLARTQRERDLTLEGIVP